MFLFFVDQILTGQTNYNSRMDSLLNKCLHQPSTTVVNRKHKF
ncbi:hypothetical protein THZG08_20240 [Vibrio owensii]|uniref:Uncharacterized protein n=1 Tax=Vibrio jasicida TaxID=766224 RepID=A0AAU9QJ43_9VIBR|nr:hypothetical protein THZG08_20240 [Vibrio owensii]CAH1558673.1 hypothetical protein THOA03_20240 [Vibrio owensii]CAH1567106.1 hypothetical protein THF1C08_150031 [Vibrio jasicida]CAH1577928.1 hypothetical protein THF1A12_150032 [Vibrio jasicida]CAH1606206.1 hypothetical protein THF5G08_220024 [Vibrio jasicida]